MAFPCELSYVSKKASRKRSSDRVKVLTATSDLDAVLLAQVDQLLSDLLHKLEVSMMDKMSLAELDLIF